MLTVIFFVSSVHYYFLNFYNKTNNYSFNKLLKDFDKANFRGRFAQPEQKNIDFKCQTG